MHKAIPLVLFASALSGCSGEPTPGSTSKSECVQHYVSQTRNEAGVRLVDLMCTQYSRPPGLGNHPLADCLKQSIGTVQDRKHADAVVRACR